MALFVLEFCVCKTFSVIGGVSLHVPFVSGVGREMALAAWPFFFFLELEKVFFPPFFAARVSAPFESTAALFSCDDD